MIKKIIQKFIIIVSKKLFYKYFNSKEKKRVISNFKSFLSKEELILNDFISLEQSNNKYYNDLLSQYCETNGEICDELQFLVSNTNILPTRSIINSFFFPQIKLAEINTIASKLNENGYYVYEKLLESSICDNLYHLSENMPFTTAIGSIKGDKINFNDIKGEVCYFDTNDILNIEVIRKLICDDFFVSVAEKYFNSQVIFDFPAMWWSFPFKKRNNMDSAQFYHFDFDRIKWLKVFIYLVDVDENNGPHCYIKNSHLTGTKPKEFLKRGYVRIADEEIRKHYKDENIIHLNGKKGTIVFGDTKCWHKGNPLVSGHRLLLEFQYTSSLYGAIIRGAKFNINGIDNFQEILKYNPQFFDNVTLQ